MGHQGERPYHPHHLPPRTPFDRYRYKETSPPRPAQQLHRQFGISEREFEDRIAEEVDELLTEIENERRKTLLETLPFEGVLTKEDCRNMFSATGFPQSGSVRGVYHWAFNLDDPPSPEPDL
jgi:hypothetical protein